MSADTPAITMRPRAERVDPGRYDVLSGVMLVVALAADNPRGENSARLTQGD